MERVSETRFVGHPNAKNANDLVVEYALVTGLLRDLRKELLGPSGICSTGPNDHLGEYFAAKREEKSEAIVQEIKNELLGCEICSRKLEILDQRRSLRKRLGSVKRSIGRLGAKSLPKPLPAAPKEGENGQ